MTALTKSDVRSIFTRLRGWCQQLQNKPTTLQSQDQKLRFEKELLRARLEVLGLVQQCIMQLAFAMSCSALWNVKTAPSKASLMQAAMPLTGYTMHSLIQIGIIEIKTNINFRCFEVVIVSMWWASLLSFFYTEDFEIHFGFAEMLSVFMVVLPVIFMDLLPTYPTIVPGGLVFSFKKWQSDGVEVTATHIGSFLTLYLFFASVVAFIIYAIQCSIADKIESNDDRSLLLGFRKVLKGVCDGNLVLDGRNFKVVDDSLPLEQLLKADKKLVDCNFLDLFLDTESRQRFMQFLNSQSTPSAGFSSDLGNTATMPSGFRVRLQGAQGPVSVDVFCTRLPDYGASCDHYLLALKEDPEQPEHFGMIPSEGMNGVTSALPLPNVPSASDMAEHEMEQRAMSQGRASSISEVLEACEELMQVSMLVSNSSPSFDIEEATFSFARSKPSSEEQSTEFGMPTLRKFIRVKDWERVEQMFRKVCHSEGRQRHHILRSPLRFRIPGGARNYVCARHVAVSLAEDDEDEDGEDGDGDDNGPKERSFWVQLSQFDTSQVQRPRQWELGGIME